MNKNRRRFAELHLHLDGAITVDIAKKLAEMQNIKLPYKNDEELSKALAVEHDCKSLNDFLKCFDLPCSLLQTKEAINEAVYLVQENIKSQGVEYAEIRFAPQLHLEKGMNMEEVVEAALAGLKRSELKCNLILCCMRMKDNYDANIETVELAHKFLITEESPDDFGVVAIDLAGAEAIYKTDQFEKIFALANKLKVPFTIHAGEADGAESVKCAVSFGARRIGHGVRSIEDEKLLEEIAKKDICMEMCPTSNLLTKAITSIDKFPILKFMEKGISVTINTDDMAICQTTMKEEVDLVKNKFLLTDRQERKLFENAIKYSFAKEKIKNGFLKNSYYCTKLG